MGRTALGAPQQVGGLDAAGAPLEIDGADLGEQFLVFREGPFGGPHSIMSSTVVSPMSLAVDTYRSKVERVMAERRHGFSLVRQGWQWVVGLFAQQRAKFLRFLPVGGHIRVVKVERLEI